MKRVAICGIVAAMLTMSAVVAGAVGPPTLTIPTRLHEKQTVSVVGTGFVPNSIISVTECRTPFTDPRPGPVAIDDCGLDLGITLQFTTTDASGNFTLAYVVRQRFRAYDGATVNCRRTVCVLSAVNLSTINSGFPEGATVVLGFGSHG